MNPKNHEHVIIIILKDKIQLYEVKNNKHILLRIDAKDYVEGTNLRASLEKITGWLLEEYDIELSSFKFTIIYEKYNIEMMNIVSAMFLKSAGVDFISADTLMPLIANKIKPGETALIKFSEVSTDLIVKYAISGSNEPVVYSKKTKEVENEIIELKKSLEEATKQNKNIKNENVQLKKDIEEISKQNKKNKNETSVVIKESAEIKKSGEIKKAGDIISIELGYENILKMAYIPPGKFMMGDDECEGASPIHPVTITKGFYMGIYPVTQDQWKEIMGDNPSFFSDSGLDHPVENIKLEECQEFIKILNKLKLKDGIFRLPTEAEWEYACRAGTTTQYYWGDEMNDKYCWFEDNSYGNTTQPVGKKKSNKWNLFDMLGNVAEWCPDMYDEDYYSESPKVDPPGSKFGSWPVMRGGCFRSRYADCKSSSRKLDSFSIPCEDIGFRLVFSPK